MERRRKRLALLACILGSTVIGIDGSAIGVALPAIRNELGGGLAGQQWAANAYLITLGSLLLLGGALGDAYGERPIFTVGLVGFGVTQSSALWRRPSESWSPGERCRGLPPRCSSPRRSP